MLIPLQHLSLPCSVPGDHRHVLREFKQLSGNRKPSWSHFNGGCSKSLQLVGERSMLARRAAGSNVSQDTDDMYDDLFKKYGKVVFRRTDQKPASAEVVDDAESLSFVVALAKVAYDVKAGDIRVLFVKPLVYWTQYFIIVTAFSRPQIDAMRTKMTDLAEKEYGKVPTGDSKSNSWTLLDYGDVVVHIFLPQQRSFYNLEEFYGNATQIELSFDNQPPFAVEGNRSA